MRPFTKHSGLVLPLDRANVDTDQIIPKQFLKRIERSGFEDVLFYDWRYLSDGTPNPEFELNDPRYANASVLLAGKNFGGGSSREHAPWALDNYGFRVLISASFADIFYNNCFKNGILPIVLSEADMATLMGRATSTPGYRLTADLESRLLTDDYGFSASFEVDVFRRHCLLNGLDDIGLTLQNEADITAFEIGRPDYRS